MMRKTVFQLLFFITFLLPFCAFSQEPTIEFKDKFHKAKGLLYYEKFDDALPILSELEKIESKNANVSYLIGVCYVATQQKNEEAIKRLEYARDYVTKAYHPSSYKERNTPVYVFYYLCVAYCYETKCDEAKIAFTKFKDLLGDDNSTYVLDVKARVEDCFKLTKSLPPAKTDSVHTEKRIVPVNLDSLKKRLPIRKVIYTTKEPLYGVQVGAFSQNIPSPNFQGLKNVQSFLDHDGMLRYVIGHYAVRTQAEVMKKMVIDAGYPDAFIVNVNEVKKYSEELLHPEKRGEVEYRVQVGAFKTYNNEVSQELLAKYFEIDHLNETREEEFTLLTVGPYKDIAPAERMKKVLIDSGITDAFIIAYVNGRKTPLSEALKYINTNREYKH